MLRFTIRMMLMDLQTVFKGLWVLLYFGVLCCFISLFFITDNPFGFLYVAYIWLSFLIPQLPKMFYVLPFDDKLIRRYLHLRGILSSLLLLSIGGIISLLSLRYPVPYPSQGWRVLIMMVQACMLMSMIHIKKRKGRTAVIITLMALLFVSNFICVIIIKDFKLLLFISFLFLFITDLFVSYALRSVHIENYTEPVYGYFNYYKNLRKDLQEGGRRI